MKMGFVAAVLLRDRTPPLLRAGKLSLQPLVKYFVLFV
jgi:hypothetical protein